MIALGASNLTRGLHAVVSTARAAWGAEVEILAALGHGRSYGARSRFLLRELPAILDSGLWRALQERPPAPARGLVTDVGNDILYGFSADQTLAWVEEAVERLTSVTRDVVVTGLPLESIRRLSEPRFVAFRSVLVPSCRLTLGQAIDAAERVHEGLARMSSERVLRFLPLDPEWYGFDPIHVRPSQWRLAWQRILGVQASTAAGRGSALEGMRLYLMPPERRWVLGVERITPQRGARLASGGRVGLY